MVVAVVIVVVVVLVVVARTVVATVLFNSLGVFTSSPDSETGSGG